ncbi:MAG: hypothetical protein JWQ76_5148 [Ramlibacter sp.]|nr:hypothetical protein [Ramlibacter sp.]
MKNVRAITLAVLTGITLISSGCAVMRGQETAGAYIDDKTITATVKTKLLEDKNTGGLSINVDTLNGAVSLAGFAKSQMEKDMAGSIARNTKGVRELHNNLIVRP